MQFCDLNIPRDHAYKLLCAANGDTALLYLYLQAGNDLNNAEQDLNMKAPSLQCAAANLRQLGLWKEKERVFFVGERPSSSETDVRQAMDHNQDFKGLYNEVQQALGRSLTTEDMKILLGFINYLNLPPEVIPIMVQHCKDCNAAKGKLRGPSLRNIEKEAYRWADMGIDTIAEASAYIARQNARFSRLGQLTEQLQIRGRALTAAEERYALQWLDWGFDKDAIAMEIGRASCRERVCEAG